MKIDVRHILVGLGLSLAVPQISALDLPVRRINGTDYYTYTVQRNESLMDVADSLGITREDILRTNPGAADGVKMGVVLYLPVSEFVEADMSRSGVSDSSDGSPLRYKVQRGETLFGIAYRFGVTPDDIVALNPQADAGVKSGQIILIPQAADANRASHAHAPVETPPNPVKSTQPAAVPECEKPVLDGTVTAQNEEKPAPVDPALVDPSNVEHRLRPVNPPLVVYENVDTVVKTSSIALMLPLGLDDNTPDKNGRSASDFVRGFLLGVNSVKDEALPVDITVYDTKGSSDEIAAIFARGDVANADVIVAPEDHASLPAVFKGASDTDAYVFNLFNAQDTSYVDNEHIMQAAIPAALMYEKAAEAIMSAYDGYQPVFLIAKGGRGEKLPFTNYLREQYAQAGVTPIDITYEGMLSMSEVADLDRTGRYVFIPSSGSLNEFNKFARTLLSLRDEMIEPSDVGVFGYPDWTMFRGDSLESLHRLGATIYSRFYNDNTDSATRAFNEAFEAEYGTEPLDQVPSQALYGYDTARYLLMNLKNNRGELIPEDQPLYRGLQSSFLFMEADENSIDDGAPAGPVNQTLYIVSFLPGRNVSVRVL